jgi:branched-chain amino acid aminotransferase
MSESIAYLNGDYIPAASASLPLHDAGFVMGATVSDLCRTFRHKLYRLDDHLGRFRASCRSAHISLPLSDEELKTIAERVTSHNAGTLTPDQDLALVMFATPGPVGAMLSRSTSRRVQPGGSLGETIAKACQATIGAHTFPLPFTRNAPLFERGAHLVVPSVRQVPVECIDPRIKQRSRLHWWLAEQEVRAFDPDALALLEDEKGRITETAVANFLIVRKGAILSPPLSTILNGVSLQVVRELAADLAIPFAEEALTLDDCMRADEALLSGTTFCVAGVSHINGSAIPWPGPTFQRLLSSWGDRVGVDIARQTLANR